MTETCSADELRRLATEILVGVGTDPGTATIVADALIAAELDDIPSHGMSRLPIYAQQVAVGKLNGRAVPVVERPAPGVVVADARNGFAFSAIRAGMDLAEPVAREIGVCVLAIRNSHHCGVAGHHVERMAERGLIGLAFANTPSAIAPWGGSQGIYGTNPIAFACPRPGAAPLVVDLSMSKVARGKLMMAAKRGETIPEGWALDRDGRSTTDPQAGLDGTMIAFGDAKGAALALMVELLAAGLTRSRFGFEASSFLDAEGEPPGVGQLFLLIDPAPFGGAHVLDRVETLCTAILGQTGTRLPGAQRRSARGRRAETGITLPQPLLDELRSAIRSHGA